MSSALLLIGTGLMAYSQYSSNRYNQKLAEQEADYQQQKTQFDLDRFNREAKINAGRMRAVMNKSGRSFSEGTGLDLLAEQAGQDELDRLIIQFGGERNESIAKSKADQFGQAKWMQPFATVLGGAGNYGMPTSSTTPSASSSSLTRPKPFSYKFNYGLG